VVHGVYIHTHRAPTCLPLFFPYYQENRKCFFSFPLISFTTAAAVTSRTLENCLFRSPIQVRRSKRNVIPRSYRVEGTSSLSRSEMQRCTGMQEARSCRTAVHDYGYDAGSCCSRPVKLPPPALPFPNPRIGSLHSSSQPAHLVLEDVEHPL